MQGDRFNLLASCGQFGFPVIVYALFECSQNGVFIVSLYRDDEGESKFFHIIAVEPGKCRSLAVI